MMTMARHLRTAGETDQGTVNKNKLFRCHPPAHKQLDGTGDVGMRGEES